MGAALYADFDPLYLIECSGRNLQLKLRFEDDLDCAVTHSKLDHCASYARRVASVLRPSLLRIPRPREGFQIGMSISEVDI